MSKSVKFVFKDEKENTKNITIPGPKDNISTEEANSFGNFVTQNEIFNGKSGKLKSYQGAYIVTRSEVKL